MDPGRTIFDCGGTLRASEPIAHTVWPEADVE
jgi:hypothetical protein